MFKTIKLAKSNSFYLYFIHRGQTICIFDNQKDLIKEILNKLNIVDAGDVADLQYLKDKLIEETADIYLECWKDNQSNEYEI